jgi:hypothetical protein
MIAAVLRPAFFLFVSAPWPYQLRMLRTLAIAFLVSAGLTTGGVSAASAVQIHKQAYHGWHQSLTMDNGKAAVVIVPEIGRVMQFRFAGEETGPFWENRSLDGKSPNSQSAEWINFGGDKTWPAPQSEWEKITRRGWPPPKAFDSLPVEAEVNGDTVVLKSKVDPDYGIQTVRRIRLHPSEAEMEIETTYLKLEGAPVRVSVWVILRVTTNSRKSSPRISKSPIGW